LVVLNIFNIRERKYEIGVLTAMGMKKWKVATQFLCEILVVTMVAILVGTGIGAVCAVPVTNALLENQVESQERRLKELAPAVKNMERLAADFSANPEEILPEPGTLETGRAYREKKAKPLLAQIVKVLRSLYLAYVELRGKFERLQGDYGRVRESNIRLSDRLQEVKLENKAMRQVSADYERVKRAFGPEQVDRILEAAYQQEHAEKERKRAAKSKIRIDAR